MVEEFNQIARVSIELKQEAPTKVAIARQILMARAQSEDSRCPQLQHLHHKH